MLTIAIPTFNRSKEISALCNNLHAEILKLDTQSVKVVISNNGSTDDTYKVLNAIGHEFASLFTIHHQAQNIGYDRNIDFLLRNIHDDFVLFLSDDDGVETGAILTVLEYLSLEKIADITIFENRFYDSQLLNRLDIREDFFKELEMGTGGGEVFYPIGTQIFSTLKSEFFGGISGLCFRTKLAAAVDTKKYFDTNWIHFGILNSLLNNSSLRVVCDPLIKYRLDNKSTRWNDIEVHAGILSIYMLHAKEERRGLYFGAIRKYESMFRNSLIGNSRLGICRAVGIFSIIFSAFNFITLGFFIRNSLIIFASTLFNSKQLFRLKHFLYRRNGSIKNNS